MFLTERENKVGHSEASNQERKRHININKFFR